MPTPIYNHYNANGEYTGSTVKCPGWMSPNFIAAVGNPLLTILLFPLTPILTAWLVIAVFAYKRRCKWLRFKRSKPNQKAKKDNRNTIACLIFMNALWVVWLFMYVILPE